MTEVKEITLAGEKVFLSQRCVLDVSATSNFSQSRLFDTDGTQNLYIMASIIQDSIKQTAKDFKWWEILRKAKYKKYNSIWLIQNLSPQALVTAYEAVLMLEGIDVKKKSKEPET